MDIWLINHYAVPPQYYPLARQANFAKYMQKMGHTVTIFAASTVHNSDKNLITDGQKWREETVDGIHYVYIKCKDYLGSGLKRVYNICEFAWKLPGVCKRFPKPDAIVATSMPPTSCAVGIWLARKYGCKGVAEIADLWPESIVAYGIAGPRNPAVVVLRWLEKWIYRKANAIVFTMEGAYDYIEEQGWETAIPREKVHFINNGVDLEAFQYNVENHQIDDPDLSNGELFKVVYTGSIRKVNNLSCVLDAAKQIADPRVRFLIWGDGDELPMLKERLEKENIKNVVFKGRVEKKYVPYIVSKADLNYMHGGENNPILRFGISPNKLFDYFAAGKPVLSDLTAKYDPSRTYGCAIFVTEQKGLAQTVNEAMELSSEAYQALCEASKKASAEYNFENLTQKLLGVIESLSI